jgi:enoyl-CoA hydratase/carnithine racemase
VEVTLIRSSDAEGVRTLVLDRPDSLNAFDQAICLALTEALRAADEDDAVRVVVLTGAGRAFSAGTDLRELAANGDFRGNDEDPQRFARLIDALVAFSKPLLCAVNGLAVGLGATLLGHADLVFMAESARLRCPFTSLALAPEAGASATFPRQMGRQHAMWLLLSAEWMTAAEAADAGLAWRVLPDAELLSDALDHARRLAVHPLESLRASKRLVAATFATEVTDARAREDAVFDVLLRAPESRAAVRAFVERRPS